MFDEFLVCVQSLDGQGGITVAVQPLGIELLHCPLDFLESTHAQLAVQDGDILSRDLGRMPALLLGVLSTFVGLHGLQEEPGLFKHRLTSEQISFSLEAVAPLARLHLGLLFSELFIDFELQPLPPDFHECGLAVCCAHESCDIPFII